MGHPVRALLLLTLLTGACAHGASRPPVRVLGTPWQMNIGETVLLEEGALRLTLDAVGPDSRCPIDVQCITAGEARMTLTVSVRRAAAESIQLRSLEGPMTIIDHYAIRVVGLEPAPRAGVPIEPGAYRVTLVVERYVGVP